MIVIAMRDAEISVLDDIYDQFTNWSTSKKADDSNLKPTDLNSKTDGINSKVEKKGGQMNNSKSERKDKGKKKDILRAGAPAGEKKSKVVKKRAAPAVKPKRFIDMTEAERDAHVRARYKAAGVGGY
jgi:hypothetical protein